MNAIIDFLKIDPTDEPPQVKAKVEKLFERVAKLEKQMKICEKLFRNQTEQLKILTEALKPAPLISPKEMFDYMCRKDEKDKHEA